MAKNKNNEKLKKAKEEAEREEYKELYRTSKKSIVLAIILGFLLSPIAYFYLKKWVLGIVNILTFNYFLLGFLIVPIHTAIIISTARSVTHQ